MVAARNEENRVTAIYITSLSENTGKTMLCAGLGKNWIGNGKTIGYLRLVPPTEKERDEALHDALFIRKQFSLKEPADTLLSIPSGIKQVYSKISPGKDAVLIEGLPLNASGDLIEDLDAGVLLIHDFSAAFSTAMPEYRKLGKRLLGVIINKVPHSKLDIVRNQVLNELTPAAGVQLLGIIPEDRLLSSMTVAELATLLQGKILNNAEKSGELIENYMLGALATDSGEEYFNRKNNKAVILKSERPDMQLAALQTTMRCLVIAGHGSPMPVVVQQAKARKVPLISTAGDVMTVITTLEKAVCRVKFNQDSKLSLILDSFKGNINLKLLEQVSGLAAK
jgi:uncharacterized protein